MLLLIYSWRGLAHQLPESEWRAAQVGEGVASPSENPLEVLNSEKGSVKGKGKKETRPQ
jgi:hypothetical protein